MSADTATRPRPPTARPTPGRKTRRATLVRTVLLQVIAMVGIGLLLYPDAADWFASLNHNAEISGYVDSVAQEPTAQRQAILEAAYAYNDELEPGPLADPYITESTDEAHRTAVYQAYERLLAVSGTDVIGTLSYPAVGITLPIYHGTADETISKGVGHLYGTSLPVGGPSTHAVLTAHSGLPQAKLFTPLKEAKVGDQFWISVLGEDHYYEVRSIETVLPGQTDSLKIVDGEDWVTLFTCTPIGVNSHRLMVHAVRIANPETEGSGAMAISGDGISAGFPWWAVWFIGGSLAVAAVLWWSGRSRGSRGSLSLIHI